MFFKQTGSKVNKARLLGYFSLVFSFLCFILYLVGVLTSLGEKGSSTTILVATLFYIVTIGGILVISIFNLWKFPDIELLNRMYGLFDTKVWDQPVIIFVADQDEVNILEEELRKYMLKNST